jgi:predicted nuclease of restriction endonuclease-like (RecB) superfamily
MSDKEMIDIIDIYNGIKEKLLESRDKIYRTINTTIIDTYWYIGKIIMELQNGNERAEYGEAILKSLSNKLSVDFGKGFSKRNLERMRLFYNTFPIATTLSSQLTWSHYLELIKIVRDEERNFYMNECINSNWSVRELQRQKNSMLYDRLLLSTDKEKTIDLSRKGLIINEPKDVVKSPYVFEFLGLKENTSYLETDLEKALLNHLKEFLLELGKGFAFVGNQQRITLDGDYFYPDLLFYNRLAKCFVIIDLKIGKLTHQDIGQMQMYVNYYKKTQMIEGENEPIRNIVMF